MMSQEEILKMILSDVKEIKEEVKKINGRVTKLETDATWREKHLTWFTSIALVIGGFLSKIGIDWIIKSI